MLCWVAAFQGGGEKIVHRCPVTQFCLPPVPGQSTGPVTWWSSPPRQPGQGSEAASNVSTNSIVLTNWVTRSRPASWIAGVEEVCAGGHSGLYRAWRGGSGPMALTNPARPPRVPHSGQKKLPKRPAERRQVLRWTLGPGQLSRPYFAPFLTRLRVTDLRRGRRRGGGAVVMSGSVTLG